MNMAKLVATKSKDPSTKCGCVIVGMDHEVRSTGFNGFPRGVEEEDFPSRWERPEKYKWVEHAERNAIYNAARNGVSLNGCSAFITGPPCSDCAKGLIQAGICLVRYETPTDPGYIERWGMEFDLVDTMFSEADVDCRAVS